MYKMRQKLRKSVELEKTKKAAERKEKLKKAREEEERQKQRQEKWYGPIPIGYEKDPECNEFELPEVTISPIDLAEPDTPFIPKKTSVRVFLPVCCIWDFKQVTELVSYFHS